MQHFSNQIHSERLNKCFAKSITRLVKVNLYCKKSKSLESLENQYSLLAKYNILPLKLRNFFHFCTFLFNICKNKNTSLYSKFTVKNNITGTKYVQPICKKAYKTYSFVNISVKILNKFLAAHLTDNISLFKTFLYKNINKLHEKSEVIWT